jgi:hypothetical protein
MELLASCQQNLYDTYHCCVYSAKLLIRPDPARKLSANLYDIYYCCVYSAKIPMMDTGNARNM